MRRRITRTLFAAAAAGVTVSTLGFTAAGAASAAVSSKAQPPTIGTTIGSTSSAGYEASGRDFRFITSTIRVPDTNFLTGLYPQEYIQLSNGSLTQPTGGGNAYTRAGIEPCVVARSFGDVCTTGTWVAFVEAFNNSLNGAVLLALLQPGRGEPGRRRQLQHLLQRGRQRASYVITPPSTSGTPQFYKTQAYGAIFDHAAALDDFTDSTGTPIALPPFVQRFRINQFLQGAITTENGTGVPSRARG